MGNSHTPSKCEACGTNIDRPFGWKSWDLPGEHKYHLEGCEFEAARPLFEAVRGVQDTPVAAGASVPEPALQSVDDVLITEAGRSMVNARDMDGKTPLCHAVTATTCLALVEARADIHAAGELRLAGEFLSHDYLLCSDSSSLPLRNAVQKCNPEAVRFLLQAGAQIYGLRSIYVKYTACWGPSEEQQRRDAFDDECNDELGPFRRESLRRESLEADDAVATAEAGKKTAEASGDADAITAADKKLKDAETNQLALLRLQEPSKAARRAKTWRSPLELIHTVTALREHGIDLAFSAQLSAAMPTLMPLIMHPLAALWSADNHHLLLSNHTFDVPKRTVAVHRFCAAVTACQISLRDGCSAHIMQLIFEAMFGIEFGQWHTNIELANAAGFIGSRNASGSLILFSRRDQMF